MKSEDEITAQLLRLYGTDRGSYEELAGAEAALRWVLDEQDQLDLGDSATADLPRYTVRTVIPGHRYEVVDTRTSTSIEHRDHAGAVAAAEQLNQHPQEDEA
jgi:hypothetical protein